MSRVTVILPSANEKYLGRTIQDVIEKAEGDVEVIAVLDGYWSDPPLREYPNLVILHKGQRGGLRSAINSAASIASGEYIMKADAHCMFIEGYDKILKSDCDDDWIVIPQRKSLDAEKWEVAYTGRSPVDYEYIPYPYESQDSAVRMGNVWKQRATERKDILVDDDMSFQGSCWFTHKKYFEYLGPMENQGWGSFVLEPEELGNKVWLSGGKVMVNKKCWYAHLHKGKANGRGYFMDRRELIRGRRYHTEFFMNNKWLSYWPKRVHRYDWLIDHFWPVPTWPENWQEINYSKGED